MSHYVKVAGHDGLVRDTESKAIVNTNREDYQRYLNQREAILRQKEQIDKHETDIQIIKSDMGEIKHMLKMLLNKG